MNTLKKAHIILLVIALNFFFFSSNANKKSSDRCLNVFQDNGSSETFKIMDRAKKESWHIIAAEISRK